MAAATGLAIEVAYDPPDASNQNGAKLKLIAFIMQKWRNRPLVSHQIILRLIGAATTRIGLTVYCGPDKNNYPKGLKISDHEIANINLEADACLRTEITRSHRPR